MSYSNQVKETSKFSSLVVISGTIVIVSFGVLSYATYRLYAPLNEQVRYDTFKQSQSYNDGMTADLAELKRSYDSANTDQQATIKGTINARFAAYDANRLPPELGKFLRSVRGF